MSVYFVYLRVRNRVAATLFPLQTITTTLQLWPTIELKLKDDGSQMKIQWV
jgi:hypothetical protein